jgi:ATP-dependent DNA helicase RecG
MDDSELEVLLLNGEADRVERKAALSSDRNAIRQAICAFANDLPNYQKPGVLFIGVNDNGSCANLRVTDELLRTLADMRSDGNILPFPTLTVQKRTVGSCELAVVIVEPSDAPPVRLDGRIWVRVGTRRATATREEERRLSEKRRSRDLPFDIHPLPSATLEDLNLNLFQQEYLPASLPPDILEQNQRSIEQQLASVRFTNRIEPPIYPTMLGMLVVGTDPRAFVPGSYLAIFTN